MMLGEEERKELEGVRRRADRNAHGHISYALRLQFLDDVATLFAAVGGALIMAVSAWLIGAREPNRTAEIIVAAIAAAITLVAIWQAIWQPAKRSRDHQAWSGRFFSIEDSCRLGLAELAVVDLQELMRELQTAGGEADLIPERRWRRDQGKTVVTT